MGTLGLTFQIEKIGASVGLTFQIEGKFYGKLYDQSSDFHKTVQKNFTSPHLRIFTHTNHNWEHADKFTLIPSLAT